METLRRGLILGIAFGLAASTVEIWLNLVGFVMRRFGPGVGFFGRVAVLEIVLAALIGVLAAPLLRLPRGTLLHVAAMTAVLFGLQQWVALDSPLFASQAIATPLGAGLLVLVGLWIASRRPLLPFALGALLCVAGMLAPQVYLRATTPPAKPRAALPPPKAGAPDVVLVVLDTVRAANLSTYGYGRPTSPGLEKLASQGALFLDATSPSTWSLPSHASLFTGRYPSSHGAHAEHRFLDDRFPTLAEVLSHNGYETFCFTANAWISDGLGLTRGFGWQDTSLVNQGGAGLGFSFIHRLLDRVGLLEADKGGDLVTGAFAQWARSRPADAERPAFVFLNFIEAHFPYHQLPHERLFAFTDRPYGELRSISVDLLGAQFGGPSPPVERVAGPTIAMYDGGVLYSSDLLERVADALRERGTLDETIFVVLADHGEVLGERAGFFGHGPSLYQESVGVPLIVRYPPGVPAGRRVEEPVSTLGVFATILDLAGLEAPPTLQASSLAGLARGEAGAVASPILSELHNPIEMQGGVVRHRPDPQMQGGRRYRLLREGDLKLVTTSTGESLLYDLAADPKEAREISAQDPQALARMQTRLASVQSELGLPELDAALAVGEDSPELDAATQERLRELGYVE